MQGDLKRIEHVLTVCGQGLDEEGLAMSAESDLVVNPKLPDRGLAVDRAAARGGPAEEVTKLQSRTRRPEAQKAYGSRPQLERLMRQASNRVGTDGNVPGLSPRDGGRWQPG